MKKLKIQVRLLQSVRGHSRGSIISMAPTTVVETFETPPDTKYLADCDLNEKFVINIIPKGEKSSILVQGEKV